MSNKKIIMRFIVLISLVFLVVVCLLLANWQIERGNEKDALYNSYQKNISSEAKKLNPNFSSMRSQKLK